MTEVTPTLRDQMEETLQGKYVSDLNFPESTTVEPLKIRDVGAKHPSTVLGEHTPIVGATEAEILRAQRRDLEVKLDSADKLLAEANTEAQKVEATKEITKLKDSMDRLDVRIEAEMNKIEGQRGEYEKKEEQRRGAEQEVSEKRAQVEALKQATQELKNRRKALEQQAREERKKRGKLREARHLLNTLIGRGKEDDTDVLVEQLMLTEHLTETEARQRVQTDFENASTRSEKELKETIKQEESAMAPLERSLREAEEKVNAARFALEEVSGPLEELLAERTRMEEEKNEAVGERAERAEKAIAEAREEVGQRKRALEVAEEEEKKYWSGLRDEFAKEMAEFEGEMEKGASEKASAARKEGVKHLYEIDNLERVKYEVGRDPVTGERIVGLAVADLAEIAESEIAKFKRMADAVNERGIQYAAYVESTKAALAQEETERIARAEQDIYVKFGVPSEGQLKGWLDSIQKQHNENPTVVVEKARVKELETLLGADFRRARAFRERNAGIEREKVELAALKRDLKNKEKAVQRQMKAAREEAEYRMTLAKRELAEEKKRIHQEMRVKKQKQLEALATFEGALEQFGPEEREFAANNEFVHAMEEAEIIYRNLGKWRNLVENRQQVMNELAAEVVAQEQLDKEALDKVGALTTELTALRSALKGLRGEARSQRIEEIGKIEPELARANRTYAERAEKGRVAIEEKRKALLPAELAAANPAKSEELEFVTKRKKSSLRELYESVIWGGEAIASQEGKPISAEATGLYELWSASHSERFYNDLGDVVSRKRAETNQATVENAIDMERMGEILGEKLETDWEATMDLVGAAQGEEWINTLSPDLLARFGGRVKELSASVGQAFFDLDVGIGSEQKAKNIALLTIKAIETAQAEERFSSEYAQAKNILEKL